jgi:hypothetical protein
MSRTGLLIALLVTAVAGALYGTMSRSLVNVTEAGSVSNASGVAAPERQASSVPERPTRPRAGDKHRTFVAYPVPQRRYDRVEQLTAESSAVVVGIPVQQVGYQRKKNDRLVLTYYQVQVLEVLKGNLQKGKKISLRVPGGYALAQDGSSFETKMPAFWKNPTVGRGYVFFIKESKGKAGKTAPYTLMGGPQGSFEIAPWPSTYSFAQPQDFADGRTIVPQVRPSDSLMKNYGGMNVNTFLQLVRRAGGA